MNTNVTSREDSKKLKKCSRYLHKKVVQLILVKKDTDFF